MSELREQFVAFADESELVDWPCRPTALQAEITGPSDVLLISIGDDIDDTHTQFVSISQLRSFAAWLYRMADHFQGSSIALEEQEEEAVKSERERIAELFESDEIGGAGIGELIDGNYHGVEFEQTRKNLAEAIRKSAK